MWQKCGNLRDRNICKFLRFELMQATSINPAFAKKLVRGDFIERLPYPTDQA